MEMREKRREDRPSAETQPDAADPTLRPGVHALPPDDLFEVVGEAIRALPSWILVSADRSARRLEAIRYTKVFRFPEDVEAWIVPGEQGSLLYCRSRSRIGFWDLGQNARNIRQLLAKAAELAVSRPARIEKPAPPLVLSQPSLEAEGEEIEEWEEEEIDEEAIGETFEPEETEDEEKG